MMRNLCLAHETNMYSKKAPITIDKWCNYET